MAVWTKTNITFQAGISSKNVNKHENETNKSVNKTETSSVSLLVPGKCKHASFLHPDLRIQRLPQCRHISTSRWDWDKNRSGYCLRSANATYIKSGLQQSRGINMLDSRDVPVPGDISPLLITISQITEPAFVLIALWLHVFLLQNRADCVNQFGDSDGLKHSLLIHTREMSYYPLQGGQSSELCGRCSVLLKDTMKEWVLVGVRV